MDKFRRRSQKVIIDYIRGEWWVMYDDGEVQVFDTPGHALAGVQHDAKRGNEDITVTTIEWRNAPDGFVPPTKGEK